MPKSTMSGKAYFISKRCWMFHPSIDNYNEISYKCRLKKEVIFTAVPVPEYLSL